MSPTILVAVDFETSGAEVVMEAQALAAKVGARVALVHVHRPPVVGPVLPQMMAEEALAESRAKDRLQALAHERGVHEATLLLGPPAASIVAMIDKMKPLMVVVGTHRRTGVARMVLGSVAEEIIRRSSAPVLTLPARRDGARTTASTSG